MGELRLAFGAPASACAGNDSHQLHLKFIHVELVDADVHQLPDLGEGAYVYGVDARARPFRESRRRVVCDDRLQDSKAAFVDLLAQFLETLSFARFHIFDERTADGLPASWTCKLVLATGYSR